MSRTTLMCFLTFTIATPAIVPTIGAQAGHEHTSTPMRKNSDRPAEPMILQENDGDHLVHTSGPLKGLPFTVKVDGQFGNAQDFFVFTEALSPGQTIPFHQHHNAEEVLIFDEDGASVILGKKHALAGAHAMIFIPRNTWISATNTSTHVIHSTALFSRLGFDTYMRSIGAKPGEAAPEVSPKDLPRLRALGHATYWDMSKGPYPPGVAHP